MKLIQGQDVSEIEQDEPVFILRGSDPQAAAALKHYARLKQDHLTHEQGIAISGALNVHADEMDAYAREQAR